MKPLAVFVALLLALFSSPAAHADLTGDVRHILLDPSLRRAHWSIKIVQLNPGDGRTTSLFESDPTSLMKPASNLKVITTSAALERLGADFEFHTLLVQHGHDLCLIGDGDPTLGDAALLKKSGWDVTTVFKIWAQGLAAQHAGPFRSLQIDDSVFDSEYVHPHWPANQLDQYYEAGVAGLNLNANCIDVYVRPRGIGQLVDYSTDPLATFLPIKNSCVGGTEDNCWLGHDPATGGLVLRGTAARANTVPIQTTVADPPMYAGDVLAEVFAANGISVGPVVRNETLRRAYMANPNSPDFKLLAENKTSLLTVMARANKDSMNLYAEACCKRLGYATHGVGSWAAGTTAVAEFLNSIGVSSDQFHLDDGCGLSHFDGITANLMISVLCHNFYGKNSKAFLSTLAVAGVDGTMLDRFRGTDLRGRVFAKSGYIDNVSCLSGYLQGRDNTWFAFSILFNDLPSGGKPIEERIVRAIDLDCTTR
ncbi:MAG TPA: D-alanyl-D-alanine carboxypeptidase/D-alanyl-D-alanine-endopeptidase [Tepidisphaeraceae bacterium]|nr:D-alanyl-D-alanine carboxypeptidase/D-alanyl-D-alanine-endopeptidase [Tepidisphaeraceae bacterium]